MLCIMNNSVKIKYNFFPVRKKNHHKNLIIFHRAKKVIDFSHVVNIVEDVVNQMYNYSLYTT